MPVNAKRLLQDLKRQVTLLEKDLLERAGTIPDMGAALRSEYDAGREAGRIGDSFESWREGVLTQAAVHWVLGCVFVRFLEDNSLIEPFLAGAGERGNAAAERYQQFFRHPDHRTDNDRDYLLHAFSHVASLPSGDRLFDRKHNPIWIYPISADAARELLAFWRTVDPDTGRLAHEFTDPDWDTRFLGDLYQDLSAWARKAYALLQTPEFVESFILDRTLEPAIREFGLKGVRLIDPTCGSGHFLLGAFHRLLGRWQREEPATLERELVQRGLNAVYGVDINPFAVAIARFRLLVAALKASDTKRLAQAPDFQLHVETGDSLLFGARRGQLQLPFGFLAEDAEAAHRILSRSYHAVVGNPPYITPKDRALRDRYRTLYPSCHGKYALSVPFMERFWELATYSKDGRSAGFVGQITANSFMKREFGKKLVKEFFPKVDLTHVIDTSGAYIPGHGTPTVLLFGRHRAPIGESVRAVMGIKGEPSKPADPAKGRVWTAIVAQTDRPGSESEFVSVADTSRDIFGTQPWGLGGGGAVELKSTIDEVSSDTLEHYADAIGFASFPGADDAFEAQAEALRRGGIPEKYVKPFVTGDIVRDWSAETPYAAFAPYSESFQPISLDTNSEWHRRMWSSRTTLGGVTSFGGESQADAGKAWWTWYRWIPERYSVPLSITFASVATHNHFVLDRGGTVFKQSSPVVKLPVDASETEHLSLLGLLNSSIACFWLQQVCHNKGGPGGANSKDEKWHDFYDFSGTKVGRFPIPDEKPLDLATRLNALAQERQRHLPDALSEQLPMPRADWERHRAEAERIRREMITLQEELDWRCYRIYGITGDELTYRDAEGRPLQQPEINLGERAFEIVLARRIAAGDLKTIWFERHGSTPITEVPSHWPEDYCRLVERRVERIEEDRYVGLVERPEYKRRWNTEPWEAQAERALREGLATRLEAPAYWPKPQLQSIRRLADRALRDADFLAVAELYRGHAGFDVHALVRELVEDEAVPFLPALRYKPSGLRKREVWEETWALQRKEDAIDAEVERELVRREGESDKRYRERIEAEQKRRKAAEVGDIPRPPKYKSADFLNATYWRLRGALDVPKERFISYPHCSRESDPSLLVGWAGWNHLEQAQALAGWLHVLVEQEGWPRERLVPVLAGLLELIPWLKQWHNEIDPSYNQRLGDFYEAYLDGQLREHELSRSDLRNWTPPVTSIRRRRSKQRAGESGLHDD